METQFELTLEKPQVERFLDGHIVPLDYLPNLIQVTPYAKTITDKYSSPETKGLHITEKYAQYCINKARATVRDPLYKGGKNFFSIAQSNLDSLCENRMNISKAIKSFFSLPYSNCEEISGALCYSTNENQHTRMKEMIRALLITHYFFNDIPKSPNGHIRQRTEIITSNPRQALIDTRNYIKEALRSNEFRESGIAHFCGVNNKNMIDIYDVNNKKIPYNN